MSGSSNILVQINTISEDDLYLVEKDLSLNEKGSIAFLLFGDSKTNAAVMLQKLVVLSLNKGGVSDILIHLSRQHPNWKEFLVEALAIMRANKVLRKLGLKLSEVRNFFLPHIKETRVHINPVLKVLYFICDKLTPIQACDLVFKVEENQNSSNHLRFYNFECLEVFFLNWIAQGKIYIGDNTADVSLLAHYFKQNDMNIFVNVLTEMAKSILSPVHDLSGDTSAEKKMDLHAGPIEAEQKEIDVYVGPTEDAKSEINACERPLETTRRVVDVCERPIGVQGSDFYEITPKSAGFILIINQKQFRRSEDPKLQLLLPEKPLSDRKGTDFDKNRLSKTFSSRGYKPIIKDNLSHVEIRQEILEIVGRSIIYQSLIVCILSHGEEGIVFGSDSIPVQISEIKEILTKLESKPKMLFIQACQGHVIQTRKEVLEFDGDVKSSRNYFDMLVANSTIPGYASLRDRNSGSWFIQTLCDKIDELGDKEDIMGILTAVHNAIHMKKGPDNMAMTPILLSTLRKKLKLPSQMVS